MRCLIVEDEKQVRESIAELVPWARLGFEAPLTAASGLEALESLRAERLDRVISDVRMPHMNGAELLKTMRGEGLETPFLFISGYSDKEYLMTAIRYRAVDYLEKPVMISELVARIHALFERPSAPKSWVTAHELFEPGARLPALFAGARQFTVGVLLVSQDGLQLTSQQLDRIVRAFHREALLEAESPERSLLVVAQTEREADFQELVDALNHAGGGYALCLSEPVEALEQLPEAYSQACECATLAWMRPLRGLHRFADQADTVRALREEAARAVVEPCERRMWPLAVDAAREALERLRAAEGLTRRDALAVLEAITGAVGAEGAERLGECACFEEAARRTLEAVEASAQAQMTRLLAPGVAQAIEYIAGHLDGALPVSEIAQAAYLSPSHLNFLFRQGVGESIRQYIIAMRIERARRLLLRGASAAEAGRQVGIADEVYFSKLFKKTTGKTPSQYVKEEPEGRHAWESEN